jgi:hypothetical protein
MKNPPFRFGVRLCAFFVPLTNHLSLITIHFLAANAAFAQGSLTPPGAPAPTMKTLDQLDAKLEKRTPISSLPFTISASGSYYLTASLTAPAMGGNGIIIAADNVTLDLNGFTIIGVAGSGSGVAVSGARRNLWIGNGTIRACSSGISGTLATDSQFERLRLTNNTQSGITAGVSAIVKDCIAELNTSGGISGSDNVKVIGCSAIDNGGYGIRVNNNGEIHKCLAFSNGLIGISGAIGCSISECVTAENDMGGIDVSSSSLVKDCVARLNTGIGIFGNTSNRITGCIATNNSTSDGIRVIGLNFVADNTCNNNGTGGTIAGIHATGNGNRIEGNSAATNPGTGYKVDGTGNLIIRNSSNGSVTPYNIAAGNAVGPIVTAATIAANSNPHANYDY